MNEGVRCWKEFDLQALAECAVEYRLFRSVQDFRGVVASMQLEEDKDSVICDCVFAESTSLVVVRIFFAAAPVAVAPLRHADVAVDEAVGLTNAVATSSPANSGRGW